MARPKPDLPDPQTLRALVQAGELRVRVTPGARTETIAIVDGTVRDVPGIGRVGLPIWAWGAVPGHGVFHLVRFGESTTVGQLRVHTGDLIFADADGCVRISVAQASEVAAAAAEVRKMEADIHGFVLSDQFTFSEWKARVAARK